MTQTFLQMGTGSTGSPYPRGARRLRSCPTTEPAVRALSQLTGRHSPWLIDAGASLCHFKSRDHPQERCLVAHTRGPVRLQSTARGQQRHCVCCLCGLSAVHSVPPASQLPLVQRHRAALRCGLGMGEPDVQSVRRSGEAAPMGCAVLPQEQPGSGRGTCQRRQPAARQAALTSVSALPASASS